MKLKTKDIKIVGEGAQVKAFIISRYGALEPFIEHHIDKYKDLINEVTIKNHLNCRNIRSKSFRVRLMYDLDIDFDKDIISEKKQIADYIENINSNISEYQDDGDIHVFNYLESLCLKKEYNCLLSELYKAKSNYYSNRNEMKESIYYLFKAIEKEKDPEVLFNYYSELGLIYYLEKEVDHAMECYSEAEKIVNKFKVDKSDNLALLYYRIGLLLSSKGNTEEARKMFQNSHDTTGSQTEKGSCLLNIGLSYKRDGNYNFAIEYYMKALELFETIRDQRKVAITYNNIAELYREKGMYKIGLGYIETALSYWDYFNASNKAFATHTYYQISLALNKNIMFDKLIEILNNTDGKCKYKRIIIEILETIIQYGKIRSIGILYQVKNIINDYLHRPIFDSFCEEIMKIYGDISLYIEDNERR